ncbi:Rpn family recombination-promoting nuclease/putative transposase [Brachyspira hyodysenteriae]|uniref:Rpn family recombination-promoting nuclease/putative transposase n=1 Tax=Brachyspira hyodysenteriae TaxID=159 RepID=UPI0022CD366E|nr:Rpn family recombination-promoting nuclease/putative transposase [Brachyspira hyodysenteriae]MCZ9852313.1 Rpn family recombination-promoting nuclease/putative transposase [Brachyspira hyodysenteriae]MCZ9869184.1 Rpn family recombination-promoting nuclease/putative transposase [Brachyspira hyodysenteriae]MCZ9875896.1 Rpn family recombination-promoting nuclease/putative transposase [Brachyspira hyodysenteriae]MCZ9877676.1 Rpn family recombination-promoting nuclease/putative transposase [Brachy
MSEIKNINVLNDYFMRYMFAKEGHERILLNLINAVRTDYNQEPFEEVKVLNTFNLKETINDKQSIVDVRAVTKSGETVLVEIQRIGNQSFVYRSLYYWAKCYVSNLRNNEKYNDLKQVIVINILDFNLLKDIDKEHSCYVIKELETNHILTNHFEMHFLELQKYLSSNSNLKEELDAWFYFLTIKEKIEKMEEIMDILVKKNPIMKEVYDEYNKFADTKDLFENYAEYEKNYFDILALSEERIRGREEGIKEGIKEMQISMARNMKNKNMDIKLIGELTGLTTEEIEKL